MGGFFSPSYPMYMDLVGRACNLYLCMKALDIVATDSGVGRGCFQLPKFVPLNAEINVFFIIKVMLWFN